MDASKVSARDREPVLYRVAKDMERRGIRGSTRILKVLQKVGYLNRPVDFRLTDAISVRVPIARNSYNQISLDAYEEDLFAALGAEIKQLPEPVTLIDVGADIGLFSLKVLAHCPSVSRIVAFEPNSEGFPWLQCNLSRLPKGVQGEANPLAIADFQGRGRLEIPEAQFRPGMEPNHTQFFLAPSPDGPIEVTMIDALNLSVAGSVVIKIDVEGGELAVLRGAAQTISAIPNVIVVIEAHPTVARRTGIDPVECLRLLASLRPFRFFVSETGMALETDKSVFDQLKPDQMYNVIARSRAAY
jgi:FkbM family methyltransferase